MLNVEGMFCLCHSIMLDYVNRYNRYAWGKTNKFNQRLNKSQLNKVTFCPFLVLNKKPFQLFSLYG